MLLNLAPGVSVPPAGSASPTAIRRLQKDYAKLMTDPIDGIKAQPNEDNILEWHYCLSGSPDTPFQGGYYWGKVIFRENFPWSPPAITMITPNGRFATNTRLCLSISDYHPESWNPGWTVSAILIGLHSFMNENQPAAGSIPGTPDEQKMLASASKEFNVKYREFRRFFPQLVNEWTGVYPTPNEPDITVVMLPEHATPSGVPVPNINAHSSRAAYMGVRQGPAMPAFPRHPVRRVEMPQIPQYADLAAMAAAQQAQMAQHAQAAAQQVQIIAQMVQAQHADAANGPFGELHRDYAAVLMQARNAAAFGAQPFNLFPAPVAAPVAAGPAPTAATAAPQPPQQRTLRPRGAAQPEQDGRRAEMLTRLGMDQQQHQEVDNNGTQLRRGPRRAARNEPDPQDGPSSSTAPAVPAKRARRV